MSLKPLLGLAPVIGAKADNQTIADEINIDSISQSIVERVCKQNRAALTGGFAIYFKTETQPTLFPPICRMLPYPMF